MSGRHLGYGVARTSFAAADCRWVSLFLFVAVVIPSCGRPSSGHLDSARPAIERGDSIQRTTVSSSALRSVGYNEDQQTLEIEFTNGAVYRYYDVPPEVYRGLMAAESHGRYFHQHVRNKNYRYQRMD